MSRSRNLADQQQRLSEATWSVLTERGLPGLTIRAVAERAGCTTGLVMHAFPTKEALLLHARDLLHSRTAEQLDSAEAAAESADAGDPRAALLAVMLDAMSLDADSVDEARVWVSYLAAALADDTLAERHRTGNRRLIARVTRLVQATRPHWDADRTRDESLALISLADGANTLATLDPETYSPAAQRRMMAAAIDRMLASDALASAAASTQPAQASAAAAVEAATATAGGVAAATLGEAAAVPPGEGEVATATPGEAATATPGAAATATPGEAATATPGAAPTATPGAAPPATPGEAATTTEDGAVPRDRAASVGTTDAADGTIGTGPDGQGREPAAIGVPALGGARIRPFHPDDTEPVIALWQTCGLTRPWNDPRKDIARKLSTQPELFLVVERTNGAPGAQGGASAGTGDTNAAGVAASRHENDAARAVGAQGVAADSSAAGAAAETVGTAAATDTPGSATATDTAGAAAATNPAGVIVGTAMAGYDGHRGWVNYLAVNPAAQGRGVGRALMAEIERALTERGCPKLNLQIRAGNEGVMAFYGALGYAPDGAASFGKRLIPDL